MYRDEPKRIGVYFNQSVSSINPSLTLIGYQGLYRSETSDPDGSWTAFHCDWAELSGETRCSNDSGVGFHNYTIRIVPYNSAGFGLASDPYRMTTKEDSKYMYHKVIFIRLYYDNA